MPESLIVLRQDKFFISGAMTFATVKALWKASEQLFPKQATWSCNFSEVTTSDSAGLALLLEWIKLAGQQKKQIQYFQVPPQMRSIAAAAGLDGLLGAVCL